MFNTKFIIASALLVAFLVSEKLNGVDAVACLACSSFTTGCGATVTSTAGLNTETCSGPCFTRTDSDGTIRRGCSSGFYFNPALSSTETCRTVNGLVWCFCSTDSCNTAACSTCSTTTVATTTTTTVAGATTAVSRPTNLRCLDCTSFNSACGATVTDTSNIGTVPCSSPNKCYTRVDSFGVIRRGCSAGFWPVVNASTTCEVKNGETWCYCESASSCNTAACTSCVTTTAPTTTTATSTSTSTTTTTATTTVTDSQLCQFITCGANATADALCPQRCTTTTTATG